MSKYLILGIYLMLLFQICANKTVVKRGSPVKGRSFYTASAVANMVIGLIGMIIINTFFRDKGIIAPALVWSAIVGFVLMQIYAMYCVVKMIFCP